MSAIIITTRFSVWYKRILPFKEWITRRFELLQHTTLPSLKQQTVQGFVWVLLTASEWYDYVSDLFKSITLPGSTIK